MTTEQAEPGGVELYESQGVIDLLIVVGVEADLVHVEGFGAVHIGDRYWDEFDLPIHPRSLSRRT